MLVGLMGPTLSMEIISPMRVGGWAVLGFCVSSVDVGGRSGGSFGGSGL